MLHLVARQMPGRAKDPLEGMIMAPNRRLKQARELRGWSQARLAEMIGTDATTVSRWERGLFIPTPHFREKLCECFGKNAEELGLLDALPTEPHLHGVVGLPREPDIYEGSGLSSPTSLPGRGEMLALKPRPIPEGVDTFTYILQRSSQEQQAYMLWEHAYVQALQDQPAEAQRLGQASVSVFEQVRHPNAAVVRAWLSQQGLLSSAAANSADPSRAAEITRKRSSRPWLRVGGASVFVVLVLVAGMMLSGIASNRTQPSTPSGIKYSPQVVGENNTSDIPTPHATSTVAPAQPHVVPAVVHNHALQTPTPLPSPTPVSQTHSTVSPGSTLDLSISPTISPSQLNPHTCFKDNDGYRCELNLAVYANSDGTFSWHASSAGIPTTFNSLNGTVTPGKKFQDIVYIHTMMCSQKGTLSFEFIAPSSTHMNTISVSWGC
jgi:transcriptional regulator with XRE-family HTH domain